jgi:hypothetical protein
MTEVFPPIIFIDVYRGKQRVAAKLAGRPQVWRWRAISEGNGRKMATSGEAFINLSDCLHSIELLFGTTATVFLRQEEQGNQLLRRAGKEPF